MPPPTASTVFAPRPRRYRPDALLPKYKLTPLDRAFLPTPAPERLTMFQAARLMVALGMAGEVRFRMDVRTGRVTTGRREQRLRDRSDLWWQRILAVDV